MSWANVTSFLEAGVARGAYPGAVALVGDLTGGTVYAHAVGNLTNDGHPPPLSAAGPMRLDTRFDLASLTKVVATTSAVALLYQWGDLTLDTPATQILGPGFAQGGKGAITVRHLLTHSAGFAPDPNPNYWEPPFGCGGPLPPQSTSAAAACASRARAALDAEPLARPVGSGYVYSDLSFITLLWIVGTLGTKHVSPSDLDARHCRPALSRAAGLQCAYEAFVRTRVLAPLGMRSTGFWPTPAERAAAAPCTVPTAEGVGRVVLQGVVSDGNAYVLGGVSGHAGLFSTAADLALLARAWAFGGGAEPGVAPFLSRETVALFTREANRSLSSRALGWNTNDAAADPDRGWNLACGVRWPAATFTHVGYAGTQLCVDAAHRRAFSILLTNRVYPSDAHSQMHSVRQGFGDAVAAALDARFSARLHYE